MTFIDVKKTIPSIEGPISFFLADFSGCSSQPKLAPEDPNHSFGKACLGARIWRATKDLDLFLTPEDMPAATRCLNGFRCEVRDPVWLHKAHRHGFFIDLITGMSNAVFQVDRSWIENARPAMILDVRGRVLAAEELLVSKSLCGAS